jgi:hypothetical protein
VGAAAAKRQMVEKRRRNSESRQKKRLSVYKWLGDTSPLWECYKTPLRAASRKGVSLHEKASRGERGCCKAHMQGRWRRLMAAGFFGVIPLSVIILTIQKELVKSFLKIFLKNGHKSQKRSMPG